MQVKTVKQINTDKNTGNADVIEVDTELFDPELESGADRDIAFDNLLEELGEAGVKSQVQIYKRETESGVKRDVWLFDCIPAEFSKADIQDTYGGGDYRIKVFGPVDKGDGSKYYGLRSNKVHSIGAPRNGVKNQMQQYPQSNVAETVATAISPILAAMQKQQEMLFNALLANRPASGGGMDDFVKFATALGALPKPEKAPDAMSALRDAVGLLKDIRGETPVDNEGKVDTGALVMTKGMDLLGKILESAGRSQQPALPAPATQQTKQIESVAETSPDQKEIDEMTIAAKAQMTAILLAAKANIDPDAYAELIYTQAPEEVIMLLQDDDWFDKLQKFDNRVAPYKEWFAKLRDIIIELLRQDNLTPDSGNGTNGLSSDSPIGNGDIPNGDSE